MTSPKPQQPTEHARDTPHTPHQASAPEHRSHRSRPPDQCREDSHNADTPTLLFTSPNCNRPPQPQPPPRRVNGELQEEDCTYPRHTLTTRETATTRAENPPDMTDIPKPIQQHADDSTTHPRAPPTPSSPDKPAGAPLIMLKELKKNKQAEGPDQATRGMFSPRHPLSIGNEH